MLDSVLAGKVQLGFDIATSATIIGSLLLWGFETSRRAKKERLEKEKQKAQDQKRGINQRVRATSLNKVLGILTEFEDSFSDLVCAASKFENPIDRRIGRTDEGNTDFSKLRRELENNPDFVLESLKRLQNVRAGVDQYYESIQKRRYSLIPVLDAIPGGEEFLAELLKDIEEIGIIHNKLASGWGGLIREFNDLNLLINKHISNKPDDETSNVEYLLDIGEIKQQALSILADADYLQWTRFFVSGQENREQFMEAAKRKTLTEDDNIGLLWKAVCLFMAHAVDDPYQQHAEILYFASSEVQSARMECKDILIKLSALSNSLVLDKVDQGMEGLVARYEVLLEKKTSIR